MTYILYLLFDAFQIILPAVGEDLLNNLTPKGDILFSRPDLVTAVGIIGAQLSLPSWMAEFRSHRLTLERVDVAQPIPTKAASPHQTLPALLPVEEEEAHIEEETVPITMSEEIGDRREFIEHLRRTEFGQGIELGEQASELIKVSYAFILFHAWL